MNRWRGWWDWRDTVSVVAVVLALTLLLVMNACAHRGPLDPPMPPPIATPSPRTCTLPPVPEMPPIVGYPSPTTIYVTVSDLEAMVRATAEFSRWMRAAARCFGAEQAVHMEPK